jgi:dihydrolipoamide dehydrogenase
MVPWHGGKRGGEGSCVSERNPSVPPLFSTRAITISGGGFNLAENSTFDLVVIGSGPGGYVAAIRGGQLGLKTAIIEKDDKFGGTCLHWGCIPTKALLFNTEVFDIIKNAHEFGIKIQGFSPDWKAIQSRKDKIVKKLSQGVEYLLKKNNVEMIRGFGRLAGTGKVQVTAGKAAAREVAAKSIVLATGSEAKLLPGLLPDGKRILTNKEVLSLGEIPRSMVIIGAGAVGVEFASIFHRLGTHVTIFEMLPRIVPLEDEEVSAEVEKSFRKQGIQVLTGVRVEKTAKNSRGITVEYKSADGKPARLEAETLLAAVGRTPNTQGIGLENTRVQLDRGFAKIDGNMQTDEPGVYAIGDIVAASPLLAHVGEMEGIVAATHAAGRTVEPINYHHVPNCTYCEPEVSSVGMTEKQAREAGFKLRIGKFPFSANSKAAILGSREGFVKIVSDMQYGEILGVHMIGPRVTEMIAEAVVAMRLEATAEDLAHTIHPHPTLTEAVLEAAHAAVDQPIHI